MTTRYSPALFFAFMLFVFVCAVPGMARAQTYNDPCPSSQALNAAGTAGGYATSNPLDTSITSAGAAAAQTKLQNQQAARALFASIDAKLATCFVMVQTTLSAIGFSGDPQKIMWTIMSTIILNLLQQVCSAVLSDLNQIKTFINSQVNRLCIPLPNFGLGLGGLNLKPVTCNGVSLLQPGPSTTGKDPINVDIRTLFPKSSSSGTPATSTTVP